MKLTISDTAVKWFENEYPLDKGERLRFFGKTYGKTEVHEGFSVGIKLANPKKHDVMAEHNENERTYFTSKDDDWFFNGYDLEVDFDIENEVLIYHFHSNQ